jgi:hypothetical protein
MPEERSDLAEKNQAENYVQRHAKEKTTRDNNSLPPSLLTSLLETRALRHERDNKPEERNGSKC